MGALVFDRVEIRFPALELPEPGVHQAAELDQAGLHFGLVEDGEFVVATEGRLEIEECSTERVAALVAVGAEVYVCDAEPALRPRVAAVVRGRPEELPDPTVPAVPPTSEDLFFAAFGSAGTGLPGQRQVAAGLAAVAPEGPLDFVLSLGDQFAPGGASGAADPVFERCFDSVYTDPVLAVPFHFTYGDREHRGDLLAVASFASLHRRFSLPKPSYSFEVRSHGQTLGFFAIDTTSCLGDVRHPMTRRARAAVAQMLEASDADWKIVFGHQAMYGDLEGPDRDRAAQLRLHIEGWFEDHGVDLYLAGSQRYQAVLARKRGVCHITTGAGGGPEVAAPVSWDEDTRFAWTGGGFVTARFDGEALRVVVRDADGAALFQHRLTR